MSKPLINTSIRPEEFLDVLSKAEVSRLLDSSQGGLYELFRNCSLAVLNCGIEMDDGKKLLELYRSFSIELVQTERGIKLNINNAPAEAFVEGKIIKGISELVFAVLRDVVYAGNELDLTKLKTSVEITDAVFHILRNADVLSRSVKPNIAVCWGGHSIPREEYDYTKKVGYELGLRGLDICTGCGPGAMKGPMKGAAVGHAKQRVKKGSYIGLTEPGIIAAESPNPIVNHLVILPDIEKRLEAFVRLGHGFIVFPGGAGTAEEILYLLGILLNPENDDIPFPVIFTGPSSAREYFTQIDTFIRQTLGEQATRRYRVIIDNPPKVARALKKGIKEVRRYRLQTDDAFYYNWRLTIDQDYQQPFIPTHENMAGLQLSQDLDPHVLAVNLRRAFSGIVAGNVKDFGIRAVEKHGHYQINGDQKLMSLMDDLLASFVEQQRMKLPGTAYQPCYEIKKGDVPIKYFFTNSF